MKFHSCQVQFTLRQKFVEFEMEFRSGMKTPNLSLLTTCHLVSHTIQHLHISHPLPVRILLHSNHPSCYNSKTLELVNKKNLVLGLIQENSIENSLQDCLPFILKAYGLCYVLLAYPKQPCVYLKANMYCAHWMTSSF